MSYGDMFSVSAQVQQLATQLQITGSVNLQVYQIGGSPGAISHIISTKDSTGTYYVMTCDIQNQASCVHKVSDLLDYATKTFPTQMNFDTDTGFDTSGSNTVKYISVDYFGLKLAPSYVTSDISKDRDALGTKML